MLNDSCTIIVDYGVGNCKSVANMLRKIGVKSIISSNPAELDRAEKIILPGVGAFDNAMEKLEKYGFIESLKENVIHRKVPVLGICLGMQLLAGKSEEGRLSGLDLIPGMVKKFDFNHRGINKKRLPVPHMGWNIVKSSVPLNPLFKDVKRPMRFYFVHSYYYVCRKPEYIIGITNYGNEFTCAIRKENIYGVQFHPEKSHKFGMQLLKNFVEL